MNFLSQRISHHSLCHIGRHVGRIRWRRAPMGVLPSWRACVLAIAGLVVCAGAGSFGAAAKQDELIIKERNGPKRLGDVCAPAFIKRAIGRAVSPRPVPSAIHTVVLRLDVKPASKFDAKAVLIGVVSYKSLARRVDYIETVIQRVAERIGLPLDDITNLPAELKICRSFFSGPAGSRMSYAHESLVKGVQRVDGGWFSPPTLKILTFTLVTVSTVKKGDAGAKKRRRIAAVRPPARPAAPKAGGAGTAVTGAVPKGTGATAKGAGATAKGTGSGGAKSACESTGDPIECLRRLSKKGKAVAPGGAGKSAGGGGKVASRSLGKPSEPPGSGPVDPGERPAGGTGGPGPDHSVKPGGEVPPDASPGWKPKVAPGGAKGAGKAKAGKITAGKTKAGKEKRAKGKAGKPAGGAAAGAMGVGKTAMGLPGAISSMPPGVELAVPGDGRIKPPKTYPRPAYPLLKQRGTYREKSTVFVVENVDCSSEGNWLTGYVGIVSKGSGANGAKPKVLLKRRFAVNNYPGEGRKKGAPPSVDSKKWWCVPRKEFCYASVPFGDWGAKWRKGEVVSIKSDDVYSMLHKFVPILQDSFTRRCKGAPRKAGGE